jgi:DNA-binding response OmpR family regulator
VVVFARNPGRALNREFLIERIRGGAFGEKITTVYGIGYRLVP